MFLICLVRWGYKIKYIDNRFEFIVIGCVDGIQFCFFDFFCNMGFKLVIMVYKFVCVYEVVFWDFFIGGKGIVCIGIWVFCFDFIDVRYFFIIFFYQGLIECVFIVDFEKNNIIVQCFWIIIGFIFDEQVDFEYFVSVEFQYVDGIFKESVKVKYFFGGEGVCFFVCDQFKIGIIYKDFIVYVWGVMDGVVKIDFFDIKMKCIIYLEYGFIMVIFCEDNMVCFYIQIVFFIDFDFNFCKMVIVEEVQVLVKCIFQFYSIEWECVEWYFVYFIGQGIFDKYIFDYCVFFGGDVCYIYFFKVGQGMNIVFFDVFNFVWKIYVVEGGFVYKFIFEIYEFECKDVVEIFLFFDNKYVKFFFQCFFLFNEVVVVMVQKVFFGVEENEFIKIFKEFCFFIFGYGVVYKVNQFNWFFEYLV